MKTILMAVVTVLLLLGWVAFRVIQWIKRTKD